MYHEEAINFSMANTTFAAVEPLKVEFHYATSNGILKNALPL